MKLKQETKIQERYYNKWWQLWKKKRLRQNLYGFKKENTQTYDRHHKENSNKTQIKPKNRITNHKTESKCPATQKKNLHITIALDTTWYELHWT